VRSSVQDGVAAGHGMPWGANIAEKYPGTQIESLKFMLDFITIQFRGDVFPV
jgi:hypothetical protein